MKTSLSQKVEELRRIEARLKEKGNLKIQTKEIEAWLRLLQETNYGIH